MDDIEGAYQRLLSLGATEYQPPTEFGAGFIGAPSWTRSAAFSA